MKTEDIHAKVLGALNEIAPEIPTEEVQDDWDLRDEFDLDSLDFLRLVQSLQQTTGVNVPEADYPKLVTVSDLSGYLTERAR